MEETSSIDAVIEDTGDKRRLTFITFHRIEIGYFDHSTKVLSLDFNNVHLKTKTDKREPILFNEHNKNWILRYLNEKERLSKRDIKKVILDLYRISYIEKLFYELGVPKDNSITYEAEKTILADAITNKTLGYS